VNRLLVIVALATVVIVAAFNVRVVGQDCPVAFADGDHAAIFASCDATEFGSAVRDFEWELQQPDDYLARRCVEPVLATSRLCLSRTPS
jgi:hypothetical protein